jgi:hypothetical protein
MRRMQFARGGADGKAAGDSRTPRRWRAHRAASKVRRFWSAVVLYRFCGLEGGFLDFGEGVG